MTGIKKQLHRCMKLPCSTMIQPSGGKVFKNLSSKTVKQHDSTRRSEKQEAVRDFKHLPAVWASLDSKASLPGAASGKALLFATSLSGKFAVALEILGSVLEVTSVTLLVLYLLVLIFVYSGVEPAFCNLLFPTFINVLSVQCNVIDQL